MRLTRLLYKALVWGRKEANLSILYKLFFKQGKMAYVEESRPSYSLRKSVQVPSVQELTKDSNLITVPSRYIRSDQPLISDGDHALNFPDHQIPVIDFQKLVSEQSNSELEKFHLACKEWGFFQVRTFIHGFLIINYSYKCTYEPSSSCFEYL